MYSSSNTSSKTGKKGTTSHQSVATEDTPPVISDTKRFYDGDAEYQWVKCDDEVLSSITEPEVVNAEAYILMYVNRDVIKSEK